MTGSYSYANIATATTTVVRNGKGVLKGIVVNKAVATGAITIYDNTAASGAKIATITSPATLIHSQISLDYGEVAFTTGLTIVTSQADDITVIWAPRS